MSQSKIEWTERVWNPLTGCTLVGQGCVHCYAERMSKRLAAMGRPEYQGVVTEKGHWTGQINLLPEKLRDPLKWKKPSRIFVNSMSDLFHEKVPNVFIQEVVHTMQNANWHTFQVLTKRYDRPFHVLYPQDAEDHIWIGFSICNQDDADKARQYLRFVSDMGWRTFVSYEPALSEINWQGFEFIEWLICGGESGPGARPMHPAWARSARDFCRNNSIPFFFKQWGEFSPNNALAVFDSEEMIRVGKKHAGRTLDGVVWDEYPPAKRDRS